MDCLKNKLCLVLIMLFITQWGMGQDVLKSAKVKVGFFSSTPLEDIKASSDKGISVIVPKSKDVVFQVNIRSFEFSNKLMQQHFNESYLESDLYPTATFKGKIQENIDYSQNGTYPLTAKGILKIHGVEKERLINGTISIVNGTINLISAFDIACKDHDIKIPSIVFKKIAEVIKVNINANYKTP